MAEAGRGSRWPAEGVEQGPGLVLLTCMELPAERLMRRLSGDATPLGVCANAGGLVTADVLRSVAEAHRGHERIRVVVVHHADCAAAVSPVTLGAPGEVDPVAWSTCAADAAATVRRVVGDLVGAAVLRHGDTVVGLVSEGDAGRLQTVVVRAA